MMLHSEVMKLGLVEPLERIWDLVYHLGLARIMPNCPYLFLDSHLHLLHFRIHHLEI